MSSDYFKGYNINVIHSNTKEKEKEEIMNAFLNGKVDILVSTSVIEVGIDNPNATCIVIEHPERFGLSTLHQLRGRVGRGERASYCFLVASRGLSKNSVERLKVLLKTNDGFEIAEKDMLLRGFGDLFGIKQSGFKKMRLAKFFAGNKNLLNALEDSKLMN